jgi:hypothetical protein
MSVVAMNVANSADRALEKTQFATINPPPANSFPLLEKMQELTWITPPSDRKATTAPPTTALE